MKRLLLILGFTSEPWPWIRAGLVLAVIAVALGLWNPERSFGVFHSRGYDQQRRDSIAVVILGAALIGCLESVRKRKSSHTKP